MAEQGSDISLNTYCPAFYGERLVLSEVEGLVLKARPEGSRTIWRVIPFLLSPLGRGKGEGACIEH